MEILLYVEPDKADCIPHFEEWFEDRFYMYKRHVYTDFDQFFLRLTQGDILIALYVGNNNISNANLANDYCYGSKPNIPFMILNSSGPIDKNTVAEFWKLIRQLVLKQAVPVESLSAEERAQYNLPPELPNWKELYPARKAAQKFTHGDE